MAEVVAVEVVEVAAVAEEEEALKFERTVRMKMWRYCNTQTTNS